MGRARVGGAELPIHGADQFRAGPLARERRRRVDVGAGGQSAQAAHHLVSAWSPAAPVDAMPAAALAGQITAADFKVEGKSLFKDEFVTCGGVRLSEVDFRTMESRLRPGLHFAGEVLDVDGVTGGFNFQAAWTTGWIAGRAMAAGAEVAPAGDPAPA
ncbi:MAG: NAD(P)/FAD-dependent oxidoreductase [Opitutaceae bacterium]